MAKTSMIDGHRIAILNDSNDHAHCCKGFTLKWSYIELKDAYDKFLVTNKRDIPYIETIFKMIIPLGWFDGYLKPDSDNYILKKHMRYNCKHLDEKTGACRIYKNRPPMCRSLKSCPFPTCKTTSCSLHYNNLPKEI